MGTVYLAEQVRPVRRTVAVKLIRAGMDSAQVVARFEAERQALALMDHPNIARVFDAGATEQGRPYFVMELVKGVPITKYCDERRLPPRDRLGLFVQVCAALQHAHQKGVIHRDIKPSNVLVAEFDGRPVPKVIDFGVAKAAGPRLTEKTLYTGFGAVVGTPEYMSPEQAGLNDLDADTRSDVYALGVLLYELLTGSTPLERGRLREAVLLEVLRLVREEEPPKPSTRLSTADALASIAANRGLEPRQLSGLVRGELDWIVMRALEKDRDRRYDTANGLAMDVQRYLADEPVQACPPSALYRLRKFGRRNRGPVAAGLALAALLVLGIAGTSVGLAWAVQAERTATLAAEAEARQRREAETQRDRAQAAETLATDRLAEVTAEKVRATAAEAVAKEEAAVARAVNDFVRDDLLAEAAPEKNARARKVTVEEVLGRAAKRIAGKFDKQPRVEAAIRQTIGDTYRAMGDYPAAQPHFERALDLRRRVLGDEHPDTLTTWNNLASLYQARGKYAEAGPLLVQILELRRRVQGAEHPLTLMSMHNLAGLYRAQDRLPEAERLYLETLEIRQRVLEEVHPDTLTSMNTLAALYRAQGRIPEAEPLLVKVLDVRCRVLGGEHPATLNSMNSLAVLYLTQGQYAKAEPLSVKVLDVRRRVLGEEHPDTLVSANNLAWLLAAPPDTSTRDAGRAVGLAKTLVELAPQRGAFWNTLGVAHYRAGDWKAAIAAMEKSAELRKGGDSYNWFFLAMAHWRLGEKEKAREWYDRAGAWTDKDKPKDEELRRFREEAARLLKVETPSKPIPKSK